MYLYDARVKPMNSLITIATQRSSIFLVLYKNNGHDQLRTYMQYWIRDLNRLE